LQTTPAWRGPFADCKNTKLLAARLATGDPGANVGGILTSNS
jgi:hypothetical protein